MIEGLRPYPEMRDSGVGWLGEVPAHWEVRRLKTVFREKDQRSGDGSGVLLSMTRARGILPQAEASKRLAGADDLSKYKVCAQGDLVMNRMQAWSGMLAFSGHDGLVSPDYSVFRLIDPSASRSYLGHLIVTPRLVDQFAMWSKGIGSGFNRLYTDSFGALKLTVPPVEEQAAIVRFLDHADRRIGRHIAAKGKLIRLLEEQKQAVVHHAVTRGLNSDAPLKSSGVPWIGDIPAQWELIPLRRKWDVVDCKHLTVPFVEEGIPLASVREVQSFDLQLATAKRTTPDWFAHLTSGARTPKRGDLIYCRNVSVGACAYVSTDEEFAMGQDVCLITSVHQNGRYLSYVMRSPLVRRQLETLMVGSTFSRINVADIKALLITVPPKAEQDEIASALDENLVSFEIAIATARREIELLREYRTRLVTDVVTGKLDVRAAAAALPDMAPEYAAETAELEPDEPEFGDAPPDEEAMEAA